MRKHESSLSRRQLVLEKKMENSRSILFPCLRVFIFRSLPLVFHHYNLFHRMNSMGLCTCSRVYHLSVVAPLKWTWKRVHYQKARWALGWAINAQEKGWTLQKQLCLNRVWWTCCSMHGFTHQTFEFIFIYVTIGQWNRFNRNEQG